jgi:hypothetical protein
MPNWCPQVNPDEPWTARCVKEKIAADGKRHRCQKKAGARTCSASYSAS